MLPSTYDSTTNCWKDRTRLSSKKNMETAYCRLLFSKRWRCLSISLTFVFVSRGHPAPSFQHIDNETPGHIHQRVTYSDSRRIASILCTIPFFSFFVLINQSPLFFCVFLECTKTCKCPLPLFVFFQESNIFISKLPVSFLSGNPLTVM